MFYGEKKNKVNGKAGEVFERERDNTSETRFKREKLR